MMFSTAQEKIHLHQLVPANSNLNNATTNISFVFSVGTGRINKIQGLRGVMIKTPGQRSGTPKHPLGHWHIQISWQSCDYSSYWDTKCNFELWNHLCHHSTLFLNTQAQSKRLKEGTGVWVLPVAKTGVILFWRKAEGISHSSIWDTGTLTSAGASRNVHSFIGHKSLSQFKLTKWTTSVYFKIDVHYTYI